MFAPLFATVVPAACVPLLAEGADTVVIVDAFTFIVSTGAGELFDVIMLEQAEADKAVNAVNEMVLSSFMVLLPCF